VDPILGGEPNIIVTPLAGIMPGQLYLEARHGGRVRTHPLAP
jgi:hypothetical protein